MQRTESPIIQENNFSFSSYTNKNKLPLTLLGIASLIVVAVRSADIFGGSSVKALVNQPLFKMVYAVVNISLGISAMITLVNNAKADQIKVDPRLKNELEKIENEQTSEEIQDELEKTDFKLGKISFRGKEILPAKLMITAVLSMLLAFASGVFEVVGIITPKTFRILFNIGMIASTALGSVGVFLLIKNEKKQKQDDLIKELEEVVLSEKIEKNPETIEDIQNEIEDIQNKIEEIQNKIEDIQNKILRRNEYSSKGKNYSSKGNNPTH